jgi:hypothetical protein
MRGFLALALNPKLIYISKLLCVCTYVGSYRIAHHPPEVISQGNVKQVVEVTLQELHLTSISYYI